MITPCAARFAAELEARPLRVGLNMIFLGERAGGVGRYARELPRALLAAEPQTQVTVFVSRDAPNSLREEAWAKEVRWMTVPVRLRGVPTHLLAQFAALPPLAFVQRLDVLHSPANIGPAVTPGLASVVTLHDLIWLHRASEWEQDPQASKRMRRLVDHCVDHVDRVFAVSQAAADDFVETLGVSRERIVVTPSGVTPPLGRTAGEAKLRSRLDLDDSRVVLCVAQKRPYKNLRRLVGALPSLPEDVVLILPGSPTSYEQELRTFARELSVHDRIRFPDWLSDEELDALYGLADAFVLPSQIEGFGLPVLEAMVRGVPVACSNVTALPEVAGDAALLFNPDSQQEIDNAIRRLLDDQALARCLVARGHARAREYGWERTGAASLEGYRQAIVARRYGRTLR